MLRSGFDRTRALAARTAMLSSANEWGRTALHDATIKYALSAGALARRNQQAPQSECCSDLMCSGHLDITLLLLSYGASMTAVDSNGQTAADLARTWAIELCGPTAPPPRPVSLAQHLAPRPCGARRSVPSRVRAACGTCACAVSLAQPVRSKTRVGLWMQRAEDGRLTALEAPNEYDYRSHSRVELARRVRRGRRGRSFCTVQLAMLRVRITRAVQNRARRFVFA